MKRLLIRGIAAFALLLATAAQAQWAVIDHSNLAQNMLTASRALEQIRNQVSELGNEAQMLLNEARNLAGLDFSVLGGLRASQAASDQLIGQAQGLPYGVEQMEAEFRTLFPNRYTASTPAQQMAADALAHWQESLEAVRTATELESQSVQNMGADEQALADLVTRSQSASGALQAMQATNQLLALQSRQSMQAQQMALTQGRAVALEQARQVEVEQRALEVRRRFQGEGTPYTPGHVNFYGD